VVGPSIHWPTPVGSRNLVWRSEPARKTRPPCAGKSFGYQGTGNSAPVSSRQVPSGFRTSGIWFSRWPGVLPETTRMLPSAVVIAVGYQRPAAIGGAVLHVDVTGSKTLTSGRPYSSLMCPPGTITWPSGRSAFPEQNSHDGAFTVVNILDVGSQTVASPNRLQLRTLPSCISTARMGTTGQVPTGSQCPRMGGAVLCTCTAPASTVTVAVAEREGSAWLVAITWKVPVVGGAV